MNPNPSSPSSDLGTTLLRGIIFIVVLGALLTIAQVWGVGLEWHDYIKVVATLGIVAGMLGFVLLARTEIKENKRLRDEDYID